MGKRQQQLLPLLHKAHPYLGLNDDDQRGQRLQVVLLVELPLLYSNAKHHVHGVFSDTMRKAYVFVRHANYRIAASAASVALTNHYSLLPPPTRRGSNLEDSIRRKQNLKAFNRQCSYLKDSPSCLEEIPSCLAFANQA